MHPTPARSGRYRRLVALAALAAAAFGSVAAAPADSAPARADKAPPVQAPGDGTVRPLGLSWL